MGPGSVALDGGDIALEDSEVYLVDGVFSLVLDSDGDRQVWLRL